MALIIAFLVFVVSMISCLVLGQSILIALVIGLFAFVAVGCTKGFSPGKVFTMAWHGVRDSLVVLEIMFMIGFITAIWRASGTITFFVYYGVKFVTPPLFVLLAFLMSCLLSYILGTSFSVSGTLGVILMALARSGGVDPLITAGAVMSGIYFGDRCSPASSSAILVANVTKTDLMDNVKYMHKTGLIAVLISTGIYAFLSAGGCGHHGLHAGGIQPVPADPASGSVHPGASDAEAGYPVGFPRQHRQRICPDGNTAGNGFPGCFEVLYPGICTGTGGSGTDHWRRRCSLHAGSVRDHHVILFLFGYFQGNGYAG